MEGSGATTPPIVSASAPAHPRRALTHSRRRYEQPVASAGVEAIGAAFGIPGKLVRAEAHGSGHIHETFIARYLHQGTETRFVHQRLNTGIFRDPAGLMENVARITGHLREKLEQRGVASPERRCLTLVPARDGRPCHVDNDGGVWRTFGFIEGSRTLDVLERREQAFEVARAFGAFAEMLADLPPPPLRITIPDFHDLGRRFSALDSAARADANGRTATAQAEIDRARRCYEQVRGELDGLGGALPRRVFHHDCKVNNVLLDAGSGEALCVIDLDTSMPGTVLSDFGELVRSGTCRSPEDTRDLAAMRLEPALFEALARGYLEGAGSLLGDAERHALPVAGAVLTLMNAIRFLTDHLEGDSYFRIQRPGHNLDRARAQLRLLELLLEDLERARRVMEAAGGS